MNSSRPFSILLPDGKRPSSHRTLFGALADARTCNASRALRGLPPVRVLNRDTGAVHDIGGDENVIDVERRIVGAAS